MRLTARLTLDVTYDVNNTHTEDLRDLLLDLPTRAAQNGLLTGDSDAEVVIFQPKVELLLGA